MVWYIYIQLNEGRWQAVGRTGRMGSIPPCPLTHSLTHPPVHPPYRTDAPKYLLRISTGVSMPSRPLAGTVTVIRTRTARLYPSGGGQPNWHRTLAGVFIPCRAGYATYSRHAMQCNATVE